MKAPQIMEVLNNAQAKAHKAACDYIATHGERWPCGFAWINIKPARGPVVAAMKAAGIGRVDSYQGGYTLWNPSNHNTQFMDALQAGAEAYAQALREAFPGIKVEVYTRMD